MALAPRSSLRSLMLLTPHGKPWLSSFFSSSVVATGVPPAAPGAIDTPPAVQPPAPPGRSCPKLPVEEFVQYPIPGGPRSRPRKACLNAPEDPSPAYPAPDHGSRRTCEPVSDGIFEDLGHPVPDPSTMAVTNEPARCTQEHPKYPVPDSSSDKVSSCSSAVPPQAAGTCNTPSAPDVQPPALPDRSSRKLPVPEEAVIHPVPDPQRKSLSPVIEEPAQCTLDNPKYPSPDHGSASPSERVSEGLLDDPLHPVRDPPPRRP